MFKRSIVRLTSICLLSLISWQGVRQPAVGQVAAFEGRAVPRQGYFLAFVPYNQGDYREALKNFRSAGNSGINTGLGRWVDSICYATMMGECFYRAGDLASALEQYDAALQLMISQRGWMSRLQLQPIALGPAAVRPLPWGPSTRGALPAAFPEQMLSAQGTNIEQVAQQGGVVLPPELYPVRVGEIMRCIALAVKRRHDILGPLAVHVPLTDQIAKELATRQIPQNFWLQNLVDVQLGLAKAAAGDDQEAMQLLQRGQAIGGRLDHPLTPFALLEMGHLSLKQNQLEAAQRFYFEASISAVNFDQPDVVEEGLLAAARIHDLKGDGSVFAPLITASAWAVSNRLNRTASAIFLALAEQAAYAGRTKDANGFLTQARRAMGRSGLPLSDLGGRMQYLGALVAYQAGNSDLGRKTLLDAQSIMKVHSSRLFQTELTNKLYLSKGLSSHAAGTLFADLLREPTDADWQRDPAEVLLVEMTPHVPMLERWLEINMERRDPESILLVGEMIKRHKFYSQLELGGRALSLRWLLGAPEAMLNDAARQQRQKLSDKYPQLATQTRHMTQLMTQLTELPVMPTEGDALKAYDRATKDLHRAADDAETLLHSAALAPVPAVRLAPPLLSLDQLEVKLKEGQAMLVFVATSRGNLQAVLVTSEKQYRTWPVKGTGRIRSSIVSLMREIGNYDSNQVLAADKLTNEDWKATSAQLLSGLIENSSKALEGINELIVVPDGVLWYLPFEMLQLTTPDGPKLLIDQMAVRYAPTAGWGVPDGRPKSTAGNRVIVHGRLFSRETETLTNAAANQLKDQFPRSVVLRKRLPATTRYVAPGWQHLIVIDDIELNDRNPLSWSPAQIDQGKPGSSLYDWIGLPWGGPDVVALPGYHSRSEDGMKGKLTGDEMFLSTAGMMATGTRSMLLSRWRTGGHTSMELLREFFQTLPEQRATPAWQRSIQLVRSAELDPSAEPRLKGATADKLPSADHPFFWAGMMLVGED
ncbi:MAG: CHAT domain-containing protein [Planctomycetales bacterium]|nr:CHAT domain-containing protein [Planctomycetales bacterium]